MLWGLTKALLYTVTLVTHTFLAFYIWESENDLSKVLIYSLAYFAFIPLAAFFAGIISDKIDPKIGMLIGVWFYILQLLVLMFLQNDLTFNNITLIAAIGGIGEGLVLVCMQVIDHHYSYDKDMAKFYSKRAMVVSVLQLAVPLAAAYVVSVTNSFVPLFQLTTLTLIFTAVCIIFVTHDFPQNKFDFSSILDFPGTNPDKHILVKGVFLEGISEGVTRTVLPIIILFFVGSVLNWSFLNTAFVLVSIILAYFLSTYMDDDNSKLVYAVGALLFATASVFFITTFNLFIVVIFLLAKKIMDVIKDTSYSASLEKIIEEDRREYKLYSEYQFLIELATGFGRLIPVLILLYFTINIEHDFMIRLLLLLTGILPLITLSVLGKSRVFEDMTVDTDLTTARDDDTAVPTLTQHNQHESEYPPHRIHETPEENQSNEG